jgi:hypothetical protein
VGAIHPSTIPYSSLVVMVLKREGSLCMCLYFRTLYKLTIKHKLPIYFIDDLLDELHGAYCSVQNHTDAFKRETTM